ncbi:MAG: hypothetical protein LBK53_08665 [Heliobacteriaceae bacterium]|jgi:hypothetical protein|nr:hypothetical protein [Heliobacteriaceae bacterium]
MFKKLFKDDDKVVGLSSLKRQELPKYYPSKFSPQKVTFGANYHKNMFER